MGVVDDANLSVGNQGLPIGSPYVRGELPPGGLLLVQGPGEVQGEEHLVDAHVRGLEGEDHGVQEDAVLVQKSPNGTWKLQQSVGGKT